MPSAQYSDIGLDLILTVYRKDGDVETQLDLATVLKIYLKPPEGDVKTKTASFYTDGSDGKMKYTTIAGDLDELGTWDIQGYFETPAGKWYTTVKSFDVLLNLP